MATSVEVSQALPLTPPMPPVRLTVALLSALVDGGAFPGDYQAELVHGQVIVSPYVQARHSMIARNLFRALDAYVTRHSLGEVFGDGTCFALPHRDDTVRCPDTSFVAAGRLPSTLVGNGWFAVAPDLAVEVRSPSERRRAVTEKLDDYLSAGTQLAWVVDPKRWGVEVHLRDRTTRWVGADGTLDGGPVLPDLHLPVADVFRGVAPPQ